MEVRKARNLITWADRIEKTSASHIPDFKKELRDLTSELSLGSSYKFKLLNNNFYFYLEKWLCRWK